MHREHKVKRGNQQDATNSMFIIKLPTSTCFGHHYAHHQKNKTVYYSMRCSAWCVGCGWLWSCGAASWAVCIPGRTPHAVGHGHILLMMGIMVPETCWDRKLDNKHRISCILLVLSLHLIFRNVPFVYGTMWCSTISYVGNETLSQLPTVLRILTTCAQSAATYSLSVLAFEDVCVQLWSRENNSFW